jgi:hypothetical protein
MGRLVPLRRGVHLAERGAAAEDHLVGPEQHRARGGAVQLLNPVEP